MSVASKIPPLRFKGFEGAWTDVRLGEIGGSWFKGQPLSKNELSDDGQNKCIHYGELFTIYGAVIENVSSTTNVLRRIGSKEGDLLFPASDVTPDGLGRCSALFVDGVLLGGDLIGFRQNEVDSRFLSYAINNCRDQIVQLVTGTTVRHSSAEKLKSVVASISVNRAEQQKIGLTFRSLDALIADRESAVEKLKTLKKAMLEKMFPRAGAKVPEVRFKRFVGEWKEKRLGDVLKIGNGKDYKHLEPGSVPVYGTGGYMTSVAVALAHGPSVCIGRKGTIDNPQYLEGAFWTVDTLFYTYGYDEIDAYWLYSQFKRIPWRKYNEASGVPSLSKMIIEEVEILVPSLHEQRKIGAYFRSLDALISARQDEVGKMKDLKKGLLDRMFV